MKCENCGLLVAPVKCAAKASEIPPSCPHAIAPEDAATWTPHEYVDPVTRQSFNAVFRPNATGGTDLDLEATLKSPRVKPKTVVHYHAKCEVCDHEQVVPLADYVAALKGTG